MTEIIIAIAFLTFIFLREQQHASEVRLLSEALIAKNIYELKNSEIKHEKQTELKINNLIPESEADDEVWMGAIRKELHRETVKDKFKDKIRKLWTKSKSIPQK
jgi:hypothetical protein